MFLCEMPSNSAASVHKQMSPWSLSGRTSQGRSKVDRGRSPNNFSDRLAPQESGGGSLPSDLTSVGQELIDRLGSSLSVCLSAAEFIIVHVSGVDLSSQRPMFNSRQAAMVFL